MIAPQILIVEDEIVTRATLKGIFEAEGYHVLEAQDGNEMYAVLAAYSVDLIVLDINLPGKNGLLLGRELRESQNIPLIFLTGRDNEVDKILGLEIGADDYLTKPFNPRELTIRARNLLHRTMPKPVENKTNDMPENYCFNGWVLNLNSHTLIDPEKNEDQEKATRLLDELAKVRAEAVKVRADTVYPVQFKSADDTAAEARNGYEELLRVMTGRELKPQDRTVDVTIRRIRKRFEDHPNTPEMISTVHGEGYRFCGKLE